MDLITLDHLKRACPEQRELFQRVFPEGAEVTDANALCAVAAGLKIQWLARFLPARRRKAYYEARELAQKAYDEATAPDRKAYYDALAPAQKAYYDTVAYTLVLFLKTFGCE